MKLPSTGQLDEPMLHPKYETIIGSVTFKPGTPNECISTTISTSMDGPSDAFEGTFRGDGKSLSVKKVDPVKISLGYEDGISEVFQGKVANVTLNTFGISITAYDSIFTLCNTRRDKFYEQRTAGQIVRDIAAMGSIQVQDAEDGVRFPYYTIDSNKNTYEHLKDLSRICGFDIYCNSNDKLVFKKYKPEAKHALDYGKNIIRISRSDIVNAYEGVTVIGESPASVGGPETSHWIKKESMRSFAGNQEKALYFSNRVIRDEQTAKRIAEEKLDAIKFQVTTILELVGDPKIKLGDAVIVGGVPTKKANGEYQVRSVEHHFSKKEGFLTTVKCKGESQ